MNKCQICKERGQKCYNVVVGRDLVNRTTARRNTRPVSLVANLSFNFILKILTILGITAEWFSGLIIKEFARQKIEYYGDDHY